MINEIIKEIFHKDSKPVQGINVNPKEFHQLMLEHESKVILHKEGYHTILGIPLNITTKVETWEIVYYGG